MIDGKQAVAALLASTARHEGSATSDACSLHSQPAQPPHKALGMQSRQSKQACPQESWAFSHSTPQSAHRPLWPDNLAKKPKRQCLGGWLNAASGKTHRSI
jgi:hypothetical protein